MDARHTKYVTSMLASHFVWCPRISEQASTNGRSVYFDDSEFDLPQIAHRMSTFDAAGSVLDKGGKGGYCFGRMTFTDPFDILASFWDT